ncbi:MAG TPA: hypothetical protein VN729_01615 [Ktedonobacteraceae bacterium]|nr:hypothetical protein [Ktedonobacteraceae bacterium]
MLTPPHPPQKEGPFLLGLKARGILGRFGDTPIKCGRVPDVLYLSVCSAH